MSFIIEPEKSNKFIHACEMELFKLGNKVISAKERISSELDFDENSPEVQELQTNLSVIVENSVKLECFKELLETSAKTLLSRLLGTRSYFVQVLFPTEVNDVKEEWDYEASDVRCSFPIITKAGAYYVRFCFYHTDKFLIARSEKERAQENLDKVRELKQKLLISKTIDVPVLVDAEMIDLLMDTLRGDTDNAIPSE